MKIAVDRNRTVSFQGMRVIAILFIVLLHAGKPIGEIGCFISFFFVLSGFLFHVYSDNKEYYIHCLKKIFPIYWLTFALDFILFRHSFSWRVLPHILLLQTLWPMPEPLGVELEIVKPYYYEYLGVSWFLSCLLFCYICAPLLSRLIVKIKTRRECFLYLLITLFSLSIYFSLGIPPEYQKWAWYVSPYYRCVEYLSGMLLSRILVDDPDKKNELSSGHFGESSLGNRWVIPILCIVLYYSSFLLLHTRLWVLPNLFIVFYIYTFNPLVIRQLFGNRLMVQCASMIMPVYLLHNSIIPFVRNCGGGWIYCTVFSVFVGLVWAFLWKSFNKLYSTITKSCLGGSGISS